MRGGYCGTLLDIDLTKGTITRVPLPPEEILRLYVGGSGLGLYLLNERLRPGMINTDPETPVLVMTGPLTGTRAPNSSDWTIVTLNAHVPYAPCVTHAHGYFGARLKRAGYDGLILHGASAQPVCLWIDDANLQLRDASEYWGMDTFETMRVLGNALGDSENISVACIGPAGEELARGASVRCDLAHSASKGGAGIAWGAKKLKAIAVRGTRAVQIASPDAFLDVCDEWRKGIQGRWAEADGVKVMPKVARLGYVPGKNFTDPEFGPKWGKRYAEDMKSWKIKPIGSWECEFKCHSETLVTTGPFAGTTVVGYIAEVVEDAAANLGIEDPGTCLAMANLYDAMGCDPAESGRLIAMAFELYNKGLLTKEETGGLDLTWGNDEAARELLMQILYKQPPLGNILAQGHKAAIQALGKGSEDMFVHIKGAGFNSHDLRGWGIGLIFGMMVAGAGPTWQGMGVEWITEPSIGYPERMDPASPVGKALAAYKHASKKLFEDCTGICFFATVGVERIGEWLPKALSLATGWDFSWQEALEVGERLINLQRVIAVKRGFKKENDFEISERMLVDAEVGPAKGRVLKPHLATMMDDYYRFAGWDSETGSVKPETLRRLRMEGMEQWTSTAEMAAAG